MPYFALINLPLWHEVLSVCRLTTGSGLPESRLIARTVEGAGASSHLRGVTFLLAVGHDTEVVHSVGIIEESNLGRVSLHIAPATTLPAARH